MRNALPVNAPRRAASRTRFGLPTAVRLGGLALTLALLVACGGDKSAQSQRGTLNGQPDEALPVPEGTPGKAVTGMPDAPGPGNLAVASEPGPPEAVGVDEFGNPLPDLAQGNPEAPVDESPEAGDADGFADNEPAGPEAVAVVRDYYAAINARNYSRAYNLWSDGGRSAGQSPEQFANGFADTSGVSVQILRTGPIGAAAGSRYIEVPVTLTATHNDGTEQHFVGQYTLRRAVVDGATAEQRAWRIASADLREVAP